MYTYMIRDASKGMLDGIPSNLLYFDAPVDPHIWESSRVFVSDKVPANLRIKVQTELMQEMINAARALGATKILGLVPAVWSRWIARLGLRAEPAGPVMEIEGMRVQVAMMNLCDNIH
jgi:acyl homoserine lactone synthase